MGFRTRMETGKKTSVSRRRMLMQEDLSALVRTQAVQLFRQQGLHFTMQQVAEPLHISKKTIYTVYPSKEALLLDMVDHAFAEIHRCKQEILAGSGTLQEKLRAVIIAMPAEYAALDLQQMKELDEIYSTLGRAVKLNKSLLLLSRIENGQYTELEDVSVDEILDNLLPDLMDIYEHKQVRLVREKGEQPLVIRCNHSLAQILVSNLVKNALLHNEDGGELRILTTPVSLMIKNTGGAPLDGEKLFRRFYHSIDGKKDSTGLGLAIVRSIARISSLRLTYEWQEGMHCFLLVKENKNNR